MPYEVWGLLVDGPSSRPARDPTGDPLGRPRVDVQSALATLAPQWGFRL